MPETKVFFDDVVEGEELPSFDLTVTRTHIIKYAGAGGDFQPIHHDEEFAKAAGLPSIFAMGLMQGGMLTRLVTDWAGVGRVARFQIRFGSIVWPGDILTFKGKVEQKRVESGRNLVDLSLTVANQNGEQVIVGQAEACLPVKA